MISGAPTPGTSSRALIGAPPESRSVDLPPWTDWFAASFFFPAIDLTARIEAFATVDSGIERPTTIGPRSWIFKHAHVGHDVVIGANCEISTGAVIGGHAEIEDDVRIGLNATILPYKKIGKGARIGAGAVVTKDVPAGETWAGNPARLMS